MFLARSQQPTLYSPEEKPYMLSDIYLLFTALIVVTSIFSFVNERFLKLPPTIGIMIMSLAVSIFILAFGKIFPDLKHVATRTIQAVDFNTLLMKIMLGFLLFAGAFHINVGPLRKQIIPVITFATLGTFISTFIIGILSYLVFRSFDKDVNLIYFLIFGALISPTDPIAVLSILKGTKVSPALEAKISGESLFNDGVGVLLFVILQQIAVTGISNLSAWDMCWLFIRESGGGLLWGAALGYSSLLLHWHIDNYKVEVLITLAIVMGGYALAGFFHVSGPLAMVAAGLILGDKGLGTAMSDTTSDYVGKFWEMIDEILNALLFLLIGFTMLIIPMTLTIVWVGLITVAIVLFARWISVSIPVLIMSRYRTFEKNSVAFLTWGGLRGGISVALALSLPEEMYRNRIVTITYFVVVFSILVQGLTIKKLAGRLTDNAKAAEATDTV